MASNKPALIPDSQQYDGYDYTANPDWDTAEWNMAAGWTPPATEQAAPTKNAVDGWDTGEWNMAAGWAELRDAAAAAGLMDAAPKRPSEPRAEHKPESKSEPKPESKSAQQPEQWSAFGTAPLRQPQPQAQAQRQPQPQPAPESHFEPEQDDQGYEQSQGHDEGPGTWNPTRESTAPVRGRHRVSKQRTFGRGSAVFGVAAVAVLGVGSGVATAEGHNPLAVSLPDLPEVDSLPGIGTLIDSGDEAQAADPAGNLDINAGESLRTRILQQASQQKAAADNLAAAKDAKAAAAEKVRTEAAAKKKAAAAAKVAVEAKRLAELAKSYVKPVASYTLTAGFGETSSLWASTHTGQDFAAPTGTPVKAIHGGTITSAGWAGSYGYRIILTLPDGTELWFCHLSSMTVTSGKVATGDTIGRVGATGNVTGPHLHVEVRPGGGDPIDPLPWLRSKGLSV